MHDTPNQQLEDYRREIVRAILRSGVGLPEFYPEVHLLRWS